jgi:uncharacterized protein YndB with AHSA1/START domain
MPASPKAPRELTLTRVFDAPRDRVFAAFTDAKRLAQWWGPHGFDNPVCEIDARAGGALRIDMRGPDGTVYPLVGVVHEIVTPERLVFSVVLNEADGSVRIDNLTSVTLVEHAGKTTLTLHVRVVQASEAAEVNLQGMPEGWSQSLARLGEFVSKT